MEQKSGNNECAKKKVRPTTREANGSQFILRCCELGLSDNQLAEMTMGMVYDLGIEKANDQEEYPVKATQDDIYEFFGRG